MLCPHRPAHGRRAAATVLGDYWFHSRGFIPSAALVRLLEELGVEADATAPPSAASAATAA